MEMHEAFQQDAYHTLTETASLQARRDELTVRDVISNYERLKATIANRHIPTAEHSIRVRIHATSLGFACRLMGGEITALSVAAEIHDIGKLQVPSSILSKPGPLSDEEWAAMRKHPVWGARVAALSFPSMPEVAHCIIQHHERLDGSGYPNALADEEITTLSRILAVADAYSALTEERPFRRAHTDEEALAILMDEEAYRYDELMLEMLVRSRRRP